MAQEHSQNLPNNSAPSPPSDIPDLAKPPHGFAPESLAFMGFDAPTSCHVVEEAVADDSDNTKDGDVSDPNQSDHEAGLVMRSVHHSHPNESDVSRLREQLQNRGMSIKFDNVAKTDDGLEHELETPLPKKDTPLTENFEEDARDHHSEHTHYHHDGQHGQEHVQSHPQGIGIPMRPRPRRHSETEKEDFDAITGAPLRGPGRARYHHGEMRYPLVQTTVDELARERGYGEPPSLTSERTASPVLEEIQTPINGNGTVMSPAITTSPMEYPQPQEQTSAFPTRRSVSQRSFGSLGSVGRRHTAKSNASSLSSPARSFLAQWHQRDQAVKEPDPDEEGSEIAGTGASGYIIGRKIGYGGFSVIKEVTTMGENHEQVVCAVKIVRKQIKGKSDADNERVQTDFEREVDVWRYLKHRYILPLIAVYDTPFATFCITKLNSGGTLFDLIRTRRKESSSIAEAGLPVALARRYIYQLGSAIRYLHEDVRAVHRDIKPENCLLDMSAPNASIEGGNVLLCDFGMADFIHNEHRQTSDAHANIGPSQTSTNIQGSLEYTAPELISQSSPVYSAAADIWAYGCVMYTLLTGRMPFTHEFQPRLVLMIETGAYDREALQTCPAVSESDASAIDLVERCLTLHPDDRASIAEVLQHPWLRGCKELYEPSDFD